MKMKTAERKKSKGLERMSNRGLNVSKNGKVARSNATPSEMSVSRFRFMYFARIAE